jgi:hypothetical protein
MAFIRTTLVIEDVDPDPGDLLFDPTEVVAVISGVGDNNDQSTIMFRCGKMQTVWDHRQTLQERWAAAQGEMIDDE